MEKEECNVANLGLSQLCFVTTNEYCHSGFGTQMLAIGRSETTIETTTKSNAKMKPPNKSSCPSSRKRWRGGGREIEANFVFGNPWSRELSILARAHCCDHVATVVQNALSELARSGVGAPVRT